MSHAFKTLIIADDSPEFPIAALYAALRAKATATGLVMFSAVSPPEAGFWSMVENQMRQEAREAAEARAARFAAEIWAESGLEVESLIREGELKPELKKLLDEDHAIKMIVLAASGGESPGPLVQAIVKGQGLAGRPLPVLVTPPGLSKEEARILAIGAAPSANPPAP